MPLVREENKTRWCLKCGLKKPEVSKYGWNLCDACDSYIQLTTKSVSMDVDALFNKHRDHNPKPCCSAKKALEEIENL